MAITTASAAASCASCFFGPFVTRLLSFPFQTLSTVVLDVIPHITVYPNGHAVTSYETLTESGHVWTDGAARTIFSDSNRVVWTVDDVVLTYPTTYMQYLAFEAVTRTSTDRCAIATDTTVVSLPYYTSAASFIYPFQPRATALPAPMLQYLETLPEITSQFGSIPLSSCSWVSHSGYVLDPSLPNPNFASVTSTPAPEAPTSTTALSSSSSSSSNSTNTTATSSPTFTGVTATGTGTTSSSPPPYPPPPPPLTMTETSSVLGNPQHTPSLHGSNNPGTAEHFPTTAYLVTAITGRAIVTTATGPILGPPGTGNTGVDEHNTATVVPPPVDGGGAHAGFTPPITQVHFPSEPSLVTKHVYTAGNTIVTANPDGGIVWHGQTILPGQSITVASGGGASAVVALHRHHGSPQLQVGSETYDGAAETVVVPPPGVLYQAVATAGGHVVTAFKSGASLTLSDGPFRTTCPLDSTVTFDGQTFSAAATGSALIVNGRSIPFYAAQRFARVSTNGQTFTALDESGSIVLEDAATTATVEGDATTRFAGQTVSMDSADGVIVVNGRTISLTTSLFPVASLQAQTTSSPSSTDDEESHGIRAFRTEWVVGGWGVAICGLLAVIAAL